MLHFKPKGQYSLCCGKLNVRLTNKIRQILNSGRSFFDRQIHLKLWSVYATSDTNLFSFYVSLYLTEIILNLDRNYFYFRSVPTNKTFRKLLKLQHSLGVLWKKTKCVCLDIFWEDLLWQVIKSHHFLLKNVSLKLRSWFISTHWSKR